ncbi:MAG TPA: ATP-binding protein [Salinivirgaceae bacterium]|nr:ATP-binding protein [Salinivirgaceae bacterium]
MIKEYIRREIYEVKIRPFIGKDLIKVIVGQRRTGKSYFMFQIMDLVRQQNPEIQILYVNKEDLAFDSIKTYSDLVSFAESNVTAGQKSAIFIDEIQEIQEFEKALRHFQSTGMWDIYCTGSNAKLLSGELSTYLTGRYIEISMYSLSYPEFLVFHGLENTPENFSKYLRFGGLPYLTNLPLEENVVFEYLKNIYTTILYKDIISRYNIRNPAFLERLVIFIADNIGNVFSAKKITDYLKSQHMKFSNNIVLDYLGYLQNAYLIARISRNDLKGKRILEIGEKYYFHDTGLRHSIIAYKPNDINQLLENVVLLHLLIHGYKVTVGKMGSREIDFICDKNNNRTYIQVTLSLADENVRNREYGNLLDIDDNYRKIVVTADEYAMDSYKGIETINIREFLTKNQIA